MKLIRKQCSQEQKVVFGSLPLAWLHHGFFAARVCYMGAKQSQLKSSPNYRTASCGKGRGQTYMSTSCHQQASLMKPSSLNHL